MARTVDAERVARRREAIVLAAVPLFASRGFERTTVAEIARAAGVSAASVFYYFADKQAVFRAVFEQDLPRNTALVAEFAEAADPVRAIGDLVAALGADARDPSAPGLLVELLRRVDHDPELVEVVGRVDAIVHGGLVGLLRRGVAEGLVDPALDPAETARWILAVVDAAYLNADPARDPEPALRRTVTRYLAPPG